MDSSFVPSKSKYPIALIVSLALSACATTPRSYHGIEPDRTTLDVCKLYDQREDWFQAVNQTERRWGLSIAAQTALMEFETDFMPSPGAQAGLRQYVETIPGRSFIPSTGKGRQLDGTWHQYRDDTGNRHANPDKFADVADYYGWYAARVAGSADIRAGDYRGLYLAVREGPRAYTQMNWARNGTHALAEAFEARVEDHQMQLTLCDAYLP